MNKTALSLLIAAVFAMGACSNQPAASASSASGTAETAAAQPGELPIIDAVMTHAPEVPPPVNRDHAAKVIIKMEVVEKVMRMADGVDYMYWTFGGDVPGKFIRIREGDEVEFHLSNHPSSKMPHNIDLHAVTGQGGGAGASLTAPGHTSTFSFKALNPGLYVYHCATAPVGMHIANGMYGLILVEPKEGLPKVDKEYYVMQGDFYTKGAYGEPGLQPFDMDKALKEQPDYVVFNGHVGSMTDDKAITAKAGETVRLFVGNGGPNLVSSFHVIGEIFDKVYTEGGTVANQQNVQSTLIPAGGSAITEFKVDVPANLVLVDHSIFRAFNKGALGVLKVTGDENKTIYSGKQSDTVYLPEGSAAQNIDSTPAPKITASNKEERISMGAALYKANCLACHQADGKGIPGAFPPLAESDYLNADHTRGIKAVTHGLTGKVTVNGTTYDSIMPGVALNDEQVANVLTYVLNSFGNKGGEVTPAQAAKIR